MKLSNDTLKTITSTTTMLSIFAIFARSIMIMDMVIIPAIVAMSVGAILYNHANHVHEK